MTQKPMLILIGGPSNSGKGSIAKRIADSSFFGTKKISVIELDNYNKMITNRVSDYKAFGDFSKPENLDKELLFNHLSDLSNGKAVSSTANFTKGLFVTVHPANIIIIEGVHALQNEELRNVADLKIYLDIDDDMKLIGKIKRSPYSRKIAGEPIIDPRNFGKDYLESFDLWINKSKPSYKKYVEPTRVHADLSFYNEHYNRSTTEWIIPEEITVLINFYFQNNEQFQEKLKELKKHKETSIEELKNQLSELQEQLKKEKEKNLVISKELEKLNLQTNIESPSK